MRYGCIGERLGHSFSKDIHNCISDYEYRLVEVAPSKLDCFMKDKAFDGINVTIPYKEAVIPYLHYIDPHALEIGAVNTVVNKDGLLYGYNTDFYGMTALLSHAGVSPKNKKAVILGSGGTAKTAKAVLSALGTKEVLTVSRTPSEGNIGYAELLREHLDAEIIVNTTPVGMYPEILASPIPLDGFKRLTGVIDAIYNPLRSRLVSEAKDRGIPAEGGLYMLVAQAVRASEIFSGKAITRDEAERVFQKISADKENIVLIGMPSSGKTTVGRLIAKLTGRRFIDTDLEIERAEGLSVRDLFATRGESGFRKAEARVIEAIARESSAVISTGGGAVLDKRNTELLKMNGRTYFIDPPKNRLTPTPDRPLSRTADEMNRLYLTRHPIYEAAADFTVKGDLSADEVAKIIVKEIYG